MNITISDAIQDIEIAFHQVEYCLKASAYWDRDEFTVDKFETDLTVRLPEGDIHFPTMQLSLLENIRKAAETSIVIAYGITALTLDQALESAEIQVDPNSSDEFDQLRCVIYLVRCAYAHRFAQPYWDVYRDKKKVYQYTVGEKHVTVDTNSLNGQEFDFPQIGGHKAWHEIKDIVIERLRIQQGDTADG